ncbi:MAG: metal ABC transporter permease, partial [Candidatus Hydrogenedentes bacterium]|nr:metal ABC transporter permease [Candidatus Hydrogenedentota bacterium]
LWIMVIGALVAGACALVGCFLILRRMAMLGDAISHAVLPGIVLAFLFTGSRNIVPMLIGAGALGILTAFLTDALSRYGKLQSDASIGVTFTWLFALGVILVSQYAQQVDLDLDCVLYGEILYAPFDVLHVGGVEIGPRVFWTMAIVAVADVAFIVLGWKQLKVCAFDPGLAASMGIRVVLWHYLLMAAVSMTTVAAFESVGAILVVAMLVAPANTAYLLTDRLWLMVVLSVAFGIASALAGYTLASMLDASIAGAMTTAAGFFYLVAVFFAPRHGVLVRWWRQRRIPPTPELL